MFKRQNNLAASARSISFAFDGQFITDTSKKDEMHTTWVDGMPAENLPARATIGVADPGSPTTLIEVVVTAHT